MRFGKYLILFLCISSFVRGQAQGFNWYSECITDGITIQNSFPKGGPYQGELQGAFHPSYLVFFTRISNQTGKPIDIHIDFSAAPIPIPNAPNTYVKLFLPVTEMTLEKQKLFSYGITELESLDQPTNFQQTVAPNEDCLFNVVAFFYQTNATAQYEYRGGNRGEFFLEGNTLYYRMVPQIEALQCGEISIEK